MSSPRLQVLFIAPNIHRDSTGEEFVAFKWAEALSHHVDLTALSFQMPQKTPLGDLLPNARVVTRSKPVLPRSFSRFEAMAKPLYPVYSAWVRRFIRDERRAGHHFDLAHQIMPQAARYASPLNGSGIPYVLGPYGGLLTTPKTFQSETTSSKWYTRLRALDGWRIRHDPWLKRSIAGAELVLGVAPYMEALLAPASPRHYANVLELGIDDIPPPPPRPTGPGLRLLHVGRGVRTKGLRDVVRALGHLKDRRDITLTSAGTGEEIEICRSEAKALGIADRVRFLGQRPRAEIEALYRDADIFVFPSFREPAGNVLYEAMRWSLPVIAAARGGPDWIVSQETGIRVPVTDPDTYSKAFAEAIATLADDPERRAAMGVAARARLDAEGLWPDKARALLRLYRETVSRTNSIKKDRET